MAAPSGYDIGLQHPNVNAGVAVGFLLDEEYDSEPFVEDVAVVAHVDVTTGGVVSVASYGLGATVYRIRVLLRESVLKRDHRPVTETPATLRTWLLAFAAVEDGLTVLQLERGDRGVAFVEAVKLISGPGQDGYSATMVLADLGAG